MTALIVKTAEISTDGVYRYSLSRDWSGDMRMTFVMLNPSIADADIDDPTIRRCIAFARRENFGGINVLNLFALRATDPAELARHRNPVGPGNPAVLDQVLRQGGPVVAAWGSHPMAKEPARQLRADARSWGNRLLCLGTTKDGHPRHPLYVKADAPLIGYGNLR